MEAWPRPPYCGEEHDLFAGAPPDLVALLDEETRSTQLNQVESRLGSKVTCEHAIVVLCTGGEVGNSRPSGLSRPQRQGDHRHHGAGMQGVAGGAGAGGMHQPHRQQLQSIPQPQPPSQPQESQPPVQLSQGHTAAPSRPQEWWCSWADMAPAPEKLVETEVASLCEEYCRLLQKKDNTRQPFLACYDPDLEWLRWVLSKTRQANTTGRVICHYMHRNAPSLPPLRDEGHLLLYSQDSNEFLPVPLKFVHEKLESPSLLVLECPHAGRLVRTLNEILPESEDVVAFGTCGEQETLPWAQLGLPADLLSACLMWPVRAAIGFYRTKLASPVLQEVADMAQKLVTGKKPQDRSTPLGELTAVLTAVTDAIAWSCLPLKQFQRLFREDSLLAELCRNFLLAARCLAAFGLSASSRPQLPLPLACKHHLWDVWDTTLEIFLLRLRRQQSPEPPLPAAAPGAPPPGAVAANPATSNWSGCPFFKEQMQAFAVWLRFLPGPSSLEDGFEHPLTELPILVQGLVLPAWRVEALSLFSLFADMGNLAVRWVLLVGVRFYISKLLSRADYPVEVHSLSLSIMAKILAADAGREGFTGIKDTCLSTLRLLKSPTLSDYHRGLAAFCLAVATVKPRTTVKSTLLGGDIMSVLPEFFAPDRPVFLRWMSCFLCGELCRNSRQAALLVASENEHGQPNPMLRVLLGALLDEAPEVRAGAVHALGRIIASLNQEPPPAATPVAKKRPTTAATAGKGKAAAPAPVSTVTVEDMLPPNCKPPRDNAWFVRKILEPFCNVAPSAASEGRVDGSSLLLLETSVLVRYELLVALAPWVDWSADCSESSRDSGNSSAWPASEAETAAEAPLSRVDVQEEDVWSRASTPPPKGLGSRSPTNSHGLHHSRVSSPPMQVDQEFVQKLAQDPLLSPLKGVARFASQRPCNGSNKPATQSQHLAAALRWLPKEGIDAEGASLDGAPGESKAPSQAPFHRGRPPLVPTPVPADLGTSSSTTARLFASASASASGSTAATPTRSRVAAEQPVKQDPFPESAFFSWTIHRLQQPNALAEQREAAEAGTKSVLDLSQTGPGFGGIAPGLCSTMLPTGSNAASTSNAGASTAGGERGERGERGGGAGSAAGRESYYAARQSPSYRQTYSQSFDLPIPGVPAPPCCPWGVSLATGGSWTSRCRPVTLPWTHRSPFVRPNGLCPGSDSSSSSSGGGRGPSPRSSRRTWTATMPLSQPGIAEREMRFSSEDVSTLGRVRLHSDAWRQRDADDQPLTLLPIVDVQFGHALSGEGFDPNEEEEPYANGSLCLMPAMRACVVRGRHGHLVVVNYDNETNPAVESFNIHQDSGGILPLERRPGTTQVISLHEDRVGGDPERLMLCCASENGAVTVCRCQRPLCSWTEEEIGPSNERSIGEADASTLCVFQATPRQANAALYISWNPWSSQLATTGRDPYVRIWDLNREHLVSSFRHNTQHRGTCITTCPPHEHLAGDCLRELVFVGFSDGSLQAVDPRAGSAAATFQAHETRLKSIISITPGLPSMASQSGSLVASIDTCGVVDLWDMRKPSGTMGYEIGTTTTKVKLSQQPSARKTPLLCHAGHCANQADGGRRAIVASSLPYVLGEDRRLSIWELATGEELGSVKPPPGFCPESRCVSLGFHPQLQSAAVIARNGLESRLLLLSLNGCMRPQ